MVDQLGRKQDAARECATKLAMTVVEALGANGKTPAELSGHMAVEVIGELLSKGDPQLWREAQRDPQFWEDVKAAFLRVWRHLGGAE